MQPTNMKDIFSELVNSGNSSRNPYPGLGREGDNGEQIGEAKWWLELGKKATGYFLSPLAIQKSFLQFKELAREHGQLKGNFKVKQVQFKRNGVVQVRREEIQGSFFSWFSSHHKDNFGVWVHETQIYKEEMWVNIPKGERNILIALMLLYY